MKRKITVFIAAAAPLAIGLIAAAAAALGTAPHIPPGLTAPQSLRAPRAVSPPSPRSASPARRWVASSSTARAARSTCSKRTRTIAAPAMDSTRSTGRRCSPHDKPVARAGVKQLLLGMTRRANGSEQVTYAGHPLYRFVRDRKPGQTKGEGSQAFGAGWDVLSPAGRKIESDVEVLLLG